MISRQNVPQRAKWLLLVLLLFPCSGRCASDERATRVLVEIGAQKITVGDFLLYLRQVNPQMDFFRLPPDERRHWLSEFLSKKLFAQSARQQKLDQAPEVRARLEFFADGVLAQEYRDKLMREIPVREEELKDYYREHADEFRLPARVLVQHFLYKTAKKAVRVADRLRAGATYEELAREKQSDADALLVERNWFPRELLIPELAGPAFSLPKGATSEVIHSSYGYHVLRVEAVEPSRVQPFDAVRPEILRKVRQRKAARVFEETLDNLKNSLRVRTHFDRLQP